MAVSIDRAVAVGGVTIGLIGTGIVVLWPEKRWLGWVFIGLGLLIALLSIVWALAVWHARKEFEHEHEQSAVARQQPNQTQNAEVARGGIHVNVGTISQNADQRSTVAKHRPQQSIQPVVIERGLAQIESTKIDRTTGEVANLYRSSSYDPNNSLVDGEVAFAKFRRDDEAPISWIDAKANIEFLNSQRELLYRVDKAYWWQTEDHHHDVTSFRLGDTQRMIVALIGGDGQVFPYSGHYVAVQRVGLTMIKEFVLDTRETPLTDRAYIVRIEIIGTRDNQRRVKQSFDYDLMIEPKPVFKAREA
ncbi:MAG TPA: hypothetical protein VNG71_09220 [Pyrinomonadaceae bacterium]|nr:hypothetical protein [Pyrinomonadaceae bacterium]